MEINLARYWKYKYNLSISINKLPFRSRSFTIGWIQICRDIKNHKLYNHRCSKNETFTTSLEFMIIIPWKLDNEALAGD